MSVSSYDPDDGKPRTPRGAKKTRKRTGTKKPTNWLPPSARDEDPDNPTHRPQPLTDEQTRKIAEKCLNACLWHLSQGPRTRKQLEKVMAKHHAPADIINATIAKLEDYNYVNDEQFAENYTQSRTTFHRKGTRAIRQELTLKGVEPDTINTALEAVTEETELENARHLVAKKLLSTRNLDPQKRVQRLVSMLARKGYPGHIAYQAVREAITDEDFNLDSP